MVITQKVKALLHQLHADLKNELQTDTLLLPDGFNAKSHQFVKGEHLLNFPYLYLDFPKFYTKETMFSFRTLFWWGHYFITAWILSGEHLDQYKNNLLEHYAALAGTGLYLLISDTPWEWRKQVPHVLEIRHDNREEVAAALKTRSFLKIHSYMAFDQCVFSEEGLCEEIIHIFRHTLPIVSQS